METWQIIVSICAGLITFGTLGEKVYKYTRPVAKAGDDLRDMVGEMGILRSMTKEHRLRIAKIEEHQANDLAILQDHAKANKVVCHALIAILDHKKDGNHFEQLDEAKAKLQSYLIER